MMYKLVFAYSLLDFQQSPDYKIIFVLKSTAKLLLFSHSCKVLFSPFRTLRKCSTVLYTKKEHGHCYIHAMRS